MAISTRSVTITSAWTEAFTGEGLVQSQRLGVYYHVAYNATTPPNDAPAGLALDKLTKLGEETTKVWFKLKDGHPRASEKLTVIAP